MLTLNPCVFTWCELMMRQEEKPIPYIDWWFSAKPARVTRGQVAHRKGKIQIKPIGSSYIASASRAARSESKMRLYN